MACRCLALALLTRLVLCSGLQHNALEGWASVRAPVLLFSSEPGTGRHTLVVNVTSGLRHLDWVRVSWTVAAPTADDFLAWHVPAEGALTTGSAPVKFQPTLGAQQGEAAFRLLNLRAPGRFVLYQGGLEAPVAVASSEVLFFEDYNEPTALRLSLAPLPGQLRVHWTTRDAAVPVVRYGLRAEELTSAALAVTTSYSRDQLCGGYARTLGWMHPGALHTAVLEDLEPHTLYHYAVGDQGSNASRLGWSAISTFTTLPLPSAPVSFLVTADVGQAEVDGSNILASIEPTNSPRPRAYFSMVPSIHVARRMASDVAAGYSMVLHNGDISYARGFSALWDVFFELHGGALSHVPYMTCIGNHESNWPGHGDLFNDSGHTDSGGECGLAYDARLSMPGASPGRPWYSFDLGPVHFTQMSTEHAFAPGSEQFAWLEADLAAVDRGVTPWLVFSGHRPFLIDSYFLEDGSMASQFREALEPLWRRYAVDLTFTGHHHSYQRSCPVLNGSCVRLCGDGSAPAPVHVVAGHGGAGLSAVSHWTPRLFAAVREEHGYLRVRADVNALTLQNVRASDGKVTDAFRLVKPPDGAGIASCSPSAVPAWQDNAVRTLVLAAAAAAALSGVGGGLYACLLCCSALARRVATTEEREDPEQGGAAASLRQPLLSEAALPALHCDESAGEPDSERSR